MQLNNSNTHKRKRKNLANISSSEKKSKLDESAKINHLIKEVLFKHKGINNLYDWQIKCLKIPGIGLDKNLIYSLPTSGGKTLVAEILMFRQLSVLNKSAIFILPFVSIVQEKIRSLNPIGLDLGFIVEEYAGGKGRFPPKKHHKTSLFIATIEKAHSLINSLITENQTDQIGMLVVDELHMVGDGSRRGANLELLLVKFMKKFPKASIIGMSATLDNMDQLSKFLKAELFISDFRPIALREYVKIDKDIYMIDHESKENMYKLERKLEFTCDAVRQKRDPDNICGLILEVVPKRSCLIFCPTKKQCETLTNNLISLINPKSLCPEDRKVKRNELLEVLKSECSEVCPLLSRSVLMGIAYHHSGLTQEERKIIEEGFLDGTLSVICCTSTLAAGVNLPARRVIIRAPYVGRGFLSFTQYKQMIGRAGRAGFDSEGESLVVLNKNDQTKICDRHADIVECLEASLYSIQNPNTINEIISELLQTLIDNDYIKQLKFDNNFVFFKATEFGKAIVRGGVDISRAHDIYQSLKNSEISLNMSSYLHMLYLVTPHDLIDSMPPDWKIYINSYKKLSEDEKKLPDFLGFDENHLTRNLIFKSSARTPKDYTVNRFYLTLMLNDLWHQKSTFAVASTYKLSRGQIQNLLQSAVTLSACLSNFVEEFSTDLWAFKVLFPKFTASLSYCVLPELLPLMDINGIKKGRALLLYQGGINSVKKVADLNEADIIKILSPIQKKTVSQILCSARMLVQEKLDSLTEEVNELISPHPDSSFFSNSTTIVTSTPKKNHIDADSLDLFSDSDLFI